MKAIILMYHSIVDDVSSDPYAVTTKSFRDQMLWLVDHGYQPVPLAGLVQSLRSSSGARIGKPVVVTFDDGYQDFVDKAFPVLSFHRIPATVFLVTDMLGQAATWSSYSQQVPLMTEAEVRRVKSQGISLGSHTLKHADLTALSDDELRRELVASRMALADLGETFYSFSYPWGKHTDREVAAVKAAGYECAVTVGGTVNRSGPDPYRCGRLIMRRDLDLDSFRRMIGGPGWREEIAPRARTLVNWLMGRAMPGK